MYAKLSSRNLNLDHCPSHPTRTYTCGVITASKVYAKLSSRDLNLDHCPSHPTRTYTCGVITASKVHGSLHNFYNLI